MRRRYRGQNSSLNLGETRAVGVRVAAAVGAVLALALLAAPSFAADLQRKLPVGGRERSYTIHLPPGATDSRPMPLVIVLHGGGGNGAGAATQTGFSREADRSGFLVT